MSLTYGGTTYRSLEEQVRKNMEDISTEAESLAALTDKVDNLKTGGEKVSLTFPAGASSGTVTDEQLATLQANDANYIEMVNDKELYYLNDPGHEEGFLTYSHVGIENSKATIKTLTITVSAKSFVIVTTVVPTEVGGKLYLHSIIISDTSTGGYDQAHFKLISSKGNEYTYSEFNNIVKTKRDILFDAWYDHQEKDQLPDAYTIWVGNCGVNVNKLRVSYFVSYPYSVATAQAFEFPNTTTISDTVTEL